MIIAKFGGTSVGTAQSLSKVLDIIQKHRDSGPLIVVASALAGVTNNLITLTREAEAGSPEFHLKLNEIQNRHLEIARALGNENLEKKVILELEPLFAEISGLLQGVFLLREASLRTMDRVMGFGERWSVRLISHLLNHRGVSANFLDASDFIVTDSQFGNARVEKKLTQEKIISNFSTQEKVPIVTGFISKSKEGEMTTLGRGGSDYTASLLAAALNAHEVEIWTDVSGVLTADPRRVGQAQSIPLLSYEEAMELSHFGAKVIFPPTLYPAFEQKIPVIIKNTFDPDHSGTRICHSPPQNGKLMKGITSIENGALLTIQGSGLMGVVGMASRLFTCLARNGINIILISQGSSEHSICLAVESKNSPQAKKIIDEEFQYEIKYGGVSPVLVLDKVSIMACVGENMRHTPGIAGKIFSALGKNGVNVIAIAQGSSERNISFVVSRSDTTKALKVIHEDFFLSEKKAIHLFLVGTGLIGKELLKQLNANRENLIKEHHLDLKIAGLCNSTQMAFNPEGIPLDSWENILKMGEAYPFPDLFLEKAGALNLHHSIYVDCTASEKVASLYSKILSKSISIVTPNKKAASGPIETYLELKELSRKKNVRYLFETNVGAGLPILSTLEDLMKSGDSIIRIEAVLSGTLSYIFNTFDGTTPFSQVVLEAKERGYTEPDPREDLNGMDVARKILILARLAGLSLNLKDVQIQSLLSAKLESAPSIEAFFEELKNQDDHFKTKNNEALGRGEKLRFMAVLEGEKVRVGLESVPSDHPFYPLKGSDNIISFTTARYKQNPLVVKGPGAGSEVTAAGVFADIIKVANYL